MKSFRLAERAERNDPRVDGVIWGVLVSACLAAFLNHWFVAGVLVIVLSAPRAARLLTGSDWLSNNVRFRQISDVTYFLAVSVGVCVLAVKILEGF